MSQWEYKKLGDLIEFHRGYDLPKSSMKSGPYPVIGSNGVIGYHNEYTTEAPGVTIGRSGNTGRPFLCKSRSWSHNTTLYIRKYYNCSPQFAYYFLQTLDLKKHAGGSAVPTLNRNHIHSLEIRVPDRDTQNRIVAVLSAIDEAIDLNNRINDYLEELLLTNFDYRFGYSDSSSFNGTLTDIGEIVGGATPSKKQANYYSKNGIGWITPRDLSGTNNKFIAHGAVDITRAGYDSCSTKLMPKGSVLFSSRAPIGYIAIASREISTNQGFKSVVPEPNIGTAFVYCFLKRNAQRIADMGAGTTFPEISGKMMKSVKLRLPDAEECSLFSQFAEPILRMQQNCEEENGKLIKLRDALLPKLMSGKIDVSKVNLTQLNNHLLDC